MMGPRYGWPVIPLERHRCTQAASLSLSLPGSLEGVAEALSVEQQKDREGRALMLKMAKGGVWPETDKERLYAYGRQDVATERDVHARVGHLGPEEQKLWVLDAQINDRGNLVIPAGARERRYVVFNLATEHAQDDAYFTPLWNQMNNGGLEAMLFDLLHRDIAGWHPRNLIKTAGLVDQQSRNLSPIDASWVEMIEADALQGGGDTPATAMIAPSNDWLSKEDGLSLKCILGFIPTCETCRRSSRTSAITFSVMN